MTTSLPDGVLRISEIGVGTRVLWELDLGRERSLGWRCACDPFAGVTPKLNPFSLEPLIRLTNRSLTLSLSDCLYRRLL